MFRSLHMKLVTLMVLLIVSLMTVVGAFLINSVVGFYLDDFYNQMIQAFNNDTEFVRLLTVQTGPDEDGVLMLQKVLSDNMGALGVDGRSRNYYILDGDTGAYLAGSNDEEGSRLKLRPTARRAHNKEVGSETM
jgi:two-component system sensor histidine kinase VicK